MHEMCANCITGLGHPTHCGSVDQHCGIGIVFTRINGSEGRAVKGSAVPSIAGLPRDYMVQQMQAFKDGSRPATIMHQLSKGYSDAQIVAIAGYFAAQKK